MTLNSVFNQSGAAIQNVIVDALKERLMKPGVLAASMDPFGIYRGRLLPERYAFVICRSRQHHSLYYVCFSMFELFKPDLKRFG